MNSSEMQYLFYSKYCQESKYCKFSFLIGHYITEIKSMDYLQNELIPFLEGLKNGCASTNDQSSFSWNSCS